MRSLSSVSLLLVLVACRGERPRDPTTVARAPVAPSPAPVPTAQSSIEAWQGREYGIGVIRYAAMDRYQAVDVIRAGPSQRSDTVAVLRRDSLCFTPTRCVRSYEQMIEFDYEIPGWALLGFNADSTWARITLSPADSAGPRGWVALMPDSVEALLWPSILADKPLFFLKPAFVGFYATPDTATPVNVPQERLSDPGRYMMTPITRQGDWLRVELRLSTYPCGDTEPDEHPDTLWIRFLTEHERPRVFFFTRGC